MKDDFIRRVQILVNKFMYKCTCAQLIDKFKGGHTLPRNFLLMITMQAPLTNFGANLEEVPRPSYKTLLHFLEAVWQVGAQ